jgi:serine/threonine-protein kinase
MTADAEPVLGWRPAIGQMVPNTKWMLEKKLGEGGFGEVWLGRHTALKERRVFKFCFRADRVRSLKREVTLFKLLKEKVGEHPNIVGIREVFFDEPPYYLIMDYAEGKDLKAWCETGVSSVGSVSSVERGGTAALGGGVGSGTSGTSGTSVSNVPLEVRLEIVAQVADGLQGRTRLGLSIVTSSRRIFW